MVVAGMTRMPGCYRISCFRRAPRIRMCSAERVHTFLIRKFKFCLSAFRILTQWRTRDETSLICSENPSRIIPISSHWCRIEGIKERLRQQRSYHSLSKCPFLHCATTSWNLLSFGQMTCILTKLPVIVLLKMDRSKIKAKKTNNHFLRNTMGRISNNITE